MKRAAIPLNRWAAFLALCVALVALTRLPFSWDKLAPEYCRLNNCYCEPFQNGAFALQPITALSNLGYILAGFAVINLSQPNPFAPARWSSDERVGFFQMFGACLILAGLFSYFSHASLSRLGEWFDLMGVYLLGGVLVSFALGRLTTLSFPTRAILLVIALIAGGIQMAVAPGLQQAGIALFFGAALLLEGVVQLLRKPSAPKGLLLAALGCYAAGGLVWALTGGPVCPGGFPWHTIWHLLSAAAAYLLAHYYRFERFTTAAY